MGGDPFSLDLTQALKAALARPHIYRRFASLEALLKAVEPLLDMEAPSTVTMRARLLEHFVDNFSFYELAIITPDEFFSSGRVMYGPVTMEDGERGVSLVIPLEEPEAG